MKYLITFLTLSILSSNSFAAYICSVKGENFKVGLADREGGRTDIYIQGAGYYQITSVRGQKYYSTRHSTRVMIDFKAMIMEYGDRVYQLKSCRGAGE